MARNPFHSIRGGRDTDADLDQALADLEEARRRVDDLRPLVATRQAGAAALSTAEWQLHAALRRVEKLRSADDYRPPPLDAA